MGALDPEDAGGEVDVLPLQAIGLARAQAGKQAHRQVGPVIVADPGDQELDLFKGEGHHLSTALLEPLEGPRRGLQAMAVAALVEDGLHQAHHLVDAPGRHRLAVAAPPLGDLGLEAEQVPAVDHGQRLVAKAGQDDRVEGLADLGAVLGAPAGAGLDDPELGEFGEGGGGVVAFGRGRGRRVVTVESLGTRAVGEEGGVVESPAPDGRVLDFV